MKIQPRLTLILLLSAFAALAAQGALAATTEDIADAIDNDNRPAEDKERDAGRQPAAVLAWLGVEPGMTVLDIMASGGWYTEVLSHAVGEDGTVYAQNTPAFLQFRDGFYDQALTTRMEGDRLPNVTRLDADFDDLGLDGQVDVAITALNFHDIYNRDPAVAIAMLEAIKSTLKPGGVIGLIDHNAKDGTDYAEVHRMPKDKAIEAAKQAGFTVSESSLLANPDDDLTSMVFSPEIRGKTDRFLLKLTVSE